MAEDIFELIRLLGCEKVFVAGHDIGAMVAFSFAANYPAATAHHFKTRIPEPDQTLNIHQQIAAVLDGILYFKKH